MSKPISEVWYSAASTWVEAEAAANLLEETRGAVFAQMCAQHTGVPTSRAEMLAKASPEWEDHVKKIAAAREAANRAKIKVEYVRMRFWERNSQEANERMESKL